MATSGRSPPHRRVAPTGSFDTVFADWTAFRGWGRAHCASTRPHPTTHKARRAAPPSPRPRQGSSAWASTTPRTATKAAAPPPAGAKADALPLMFTKFPSSITGPTGQIELPTARTDFEVELVVAIRRRRRSGERRGRLVPRRRTAGRPRCLGPGPCSSSARRQHSIGKSFRTFSPLGPELVTPRTSSPTPRTSNCAAGSTANLRQKGRTGEMTYSGRGTDRPAFRPSPRCYQAT